MANNYLVPVINKAKNVLECWSKLRLSWLGRIAATRMNILPKMLFIFQNMIAVIPQALLLEIQKIVNHFV